MCTNLESFRSESILLICSKKSYFLCICTVNSVSWVRVAKWCWSKKLFIVHISICCWQMLTMVTGQNPEFSIQRICSMVCLHWLHFFRYSVWNETKREMRLCWKMQPVGVIRCASKVWNFSYDNSVFLIPGFCPVMRFFCVKTQNISSQTNYNTFAMHRASKSSCFSISIRYFNLILGAKRNISQNVYYVLIYFIIL